MKTQKRKVANKGCFLTRIEQNIQNGWIYPNALIRSITPLGRWGNWLTYHACQNNEINFVCGFPDWAGETSKSKYFNDKKQLEKYDNLDCHYLQSFVTMRK